MIVQNRFSWILTLTFKCKHVNFMWLSQQQSTLQICQFHLLPHSHLPCRGGGPLVPMAHWSPPSPTSLGLKYFVNQNESLDTPKKWKLSKSRSKVIFCEQFFFYYFKNPFQSYLQKIRFLYVYYHCRNLIQNIQQKYKKRP